MWKRILQFILILAVIVLAIFVIYSYFIKSQSKTILTPNAQVTPEKQIVIDTFKKEIRFYENGELKKEAVLPLEKAYEIIYETPAGQYSGKDFAQLFEDPSAKIIILNSPDAKSKIAVDDKGLYFSKKQLLSPLKLKSEAFIIADIETNSIISQKSPDKKMPIASISKLVTALVAIEKLDQQKTITITKQMLTDGYGGSGELRRGEKFTVGELLYPLLLSSSNDAAMAIAEDYGKKEFVKLMNESAGRLGLANTSFEEPSGISPNNISNAKDLLTLSQKLYYNQREILNITKLESANNWRNNNPFAGKNNYIGGKTGFTDEAGRTLISIFNLPLSESGEEYRKVAIILLNSEDREVDAETAQKWLESNVVYKKMTEPEKLFSWEEVKEFLKEFKTFSLLFVGDIMMNRGVEESVVKNGNGDFSFLFQKTDFIKDADITFGNLEGPVSDAGADLGNLYSFRMNPLTISNLKNAGIDMVSLANNHIGDWGRPAFEDTMSRLQNENILFAGAGENMASAVEPTIIEKDTVKIGFLAFSDVGPNGLKAGALKSGILIVDETFGEIIKNASQKVDVLVTSIHFGDEYQKTSNDRQKQLARSAVDNGAKIVIGHHPHVAQEIENYKDGLIAYSLGNFIFDQYFSEETMSGLALKVTISGNGKIRGTEQIKTKLNKFYQPEAVN